MGFNLETFTRLHVVLSLVGIAAGFVVVFGWLRGRRLDGWTALFLATTVATSVTGFLFPVDHFLPSHAVGILSLVVLAAAIYARYVRRLAGASRWIYAVSAVAALYLNVFVGIVQAFDKVPFLGKATPEQPTPAFVAAQVLTLVFFIVLAVRTARRGPA
jgi:hypothetical protein